MFSSRLQLLKLLLAKDRYFSSDEPIRCVACGSTELQDNILETVAGHIAEKDCVCSRCNLKLGYWAYGYWMPLSVKWSQLLPK